MNYNNSTPYVSYILFKNTYLTTNSPNTFYWNDSNTGGYTHSVWYDYEKGYIFANITNNNNYNTLTASTQTNANIFKNYKVNENFKKYMSLEFYQDLPKLEYTTDNKFYNIKIKDQLYLKLDNATNQIITTQIKTDATQFIIYSNTSNNITTYKYVIPAAKNNLSDDYIIGFDYINAGIFTDNTNTPTLRAYKINDAIPIAFTDIEVKTLNTDDKLHNYKLPWFEFIKGLPNNVLRGNGLFKTYLIWNSMDVLSIRLSSDISTNPTYSNIEFGQEEFIIPETTTTTTIPETTTTTTIPETTTTTIPETTTTTTIPETTTTTIIPETTTTTIPETTTTTTIPETTTTTTIPETTTTTTIPETTTTTTIPEITTSSYYSSDTLPPILPRATIFLPRG
jgi:hypothetical protein